MNDPVDVLIIGAGASGAAVAWSLAETKMHILCLDQGGWMKQSEYPSTGRDGEAKFYGEWATSPNIRGRAEDYPINDDNSPIKVVNFNAVGGSTIMPEQPEPATSTSHSKVSIWLFATQSSLGVRSVWAAGRPTASWVEDCCERRQRCQSPGREGDACGILRCRTSVTI